MRAYYHPVENAEKLIWVFAGWGMDQHVFLHRALPYLSTQHQAQASYIILFDYNQNELVWIDEQEQIQLKDWNELLSRPEIQRYTHSILWAWSMGVWAAEQYPIPTVHYALAINGTARPVDDLLGIPEALFWGTLKNLSGRNLQKFIKRMCGSTSLLMDFKRHEPKRNLQSLHTELAYIGEQSKNISPYPKNWDTAFVSQEDAIFPTTNMSDYWFLLGVPVEYISGGHYPYSV